MRLQTQLLRRIAAWGLALAGCAGVAAAASDTRKTLAYLAHKAEAIREGERSVAMTPIAKAADLLKIPYTLSTDLLRIDPNFDPLGGNPRFEKLAAKGE